MRSFDDDILQMVMRIIQRPKVFLGSKSISRLYCYIAGFSWGYDYPDVNSFFPEFQDYIEEKYHWKSSDDWGTILLKITNDEEKAFDLFVGEFTLFLSETDQYSKGEHP